MTAESSRSATVAAYSMVIADCASNLWSTAKRVCILERDHHYVNGMPRFLNQRESPTSEQHLSLVPDASVGEREAQE